MVSMGYLHARYNSRRGFDSRIPRTATNVWQTQLGPTEVENGSISVSSV
jgi:hypothetical protein